MRLYRDDAGNTVEEDFSLIFSPILLNRRYCSKDDYLENYQVCSVQYCVHSAMHTHEQT